MLEEPEPLAGKRTIRVAPTNVGFVRNLLPRPGRIRVNGVELPDRERGDPLTRAVLGDLLSRQARRQPNKPAVIAYGATGRQTVTYRELDDLTARFASVLTRYGDIGDVVAALLTPSIDYVVAYYGALRAGTPFSGVNPSLTPLELQQLLDHTEARVMVVSDKTSPTAEAVLPNLSSAPTLLTVSGHGRLLDGDQLPEIGPDRAIDEGDVAAIIYTSGTESRPKGVMLSHRNFMIGTTPSWVYSNYVVENDVFLLLAPMYTMAGIGTLTNLISVGGTVVLLDNLHPQRLLRVISDEAVSIVSQTPTFYRRLAAAPGFESADLRSLRQCHVYGGDVDDRLVTTFAERSPGLEWVNYWGQSELGQLGSMGCFRTMADVPAHNTRWIGRPLPHVEVRVVDEAGRDAPMGELICRAPSVMLGYYNDPAASARAIHGGWLWTGDIVSVDGDGNLFFEDRKKDIVKSGGMNVSTAEVEAVLRGHESVLAAAVVGIPDPEWTEAVVAVVVTRPGFTQDEEALRAYCRSHLAGYKTPKRVHFAADLPYDGQGKLRKRALRDQLVEASTADQ